jgi:hypothetical protein
LTRARRGLPLSDVILLGTEEQVRLAAQAAGELAAGRPVETAELVVSLRTFIREVLDLGPVPSVLAIPKQGPVRPAATGSRRGEKSDGGGKGGAGGGRRVRSTRDDRRGRDSATHNH